MSFIRKEKSRIKVFLIHSWIFKQSDWLSILFSFYDAISPPPAAFHVKIDNRTLLKNVRNSTPANKCSFYCKTFALNCQKHLVLKWCIKCSCNFGVDYYRPFINFLSPTSILCLHRAVPFMTTENNAWILLLQTYFLLKFCVHDFCWIFRAFCVPPSFLKGHFSLSFKCHQSILHFGVNVCSLRGLFCHTSQLSLLIESYLFSFLINGLFTLIYLWKTCDFLKTLFFSQRTRKEGGI